MDFTLSKEHEMLRDMYRKFTENEVKPLAEDIDEQERFPVETVKKLARYGFMAFHSQRNMAAPAEICLHM